MTALWTSAAIAEATAGKASTEFSVNGVAFDSREIGPGDLFVALKGEHSDGHLHVEQAFACPIRSRRWICWQKHRGYAPMPRSSG